ncbi:hypothetical protein BDR26DRAFT_863134 [Obelidium mucronatum]|nr:hypothetical protein BDR26DRAFT_863134 [Obelidium mucronatum]
MPTTSDNNILPQHHQNEKRKPSQIRTVLETIWTWINHLVVGFLFGFALEKSKVYLPSLIVGQMRWTQLTMLIVFLGATLTGLIAFAILEKFGLYKRNPKPPLSLLDSKNWLLGYGNNILGGLFVGFGMSLSGACPGTVLVQIGTGVPTTPYTLAGTLIGSVTYGYLHNLITTRLAAKFGAKSAIATLDGVTKVPALILAFVISAIGFPLLWYGTTRIPWRVDVYQDLLIDFARGRPETVLLNPFLSIQDVEFNFTVPGWSPFSASLAIGLAQIASVVLVHNVIGASSVFPYVGYLLVKTVDRNWEVNAPFYKEFVGLGSTVRFSVGVIVGGLVSAVTSGLTYGAGIGGRPVVDVLVYSPGVVARLVFGGVFLVYGSRIAGGCPSGHGLSGMAQLSIASGVSVAAMFAGGTGVAYIVGWF